MTMRYARKTVNGIRAGDAKKKAPRRKPNKPVARWKPCNPAGQFAGRGEFVNGRQTGLQAENNEIPRGHVHLPGCGCLSRKDWDANYSEEYLAAQESAKALEKRILSHESNGSRCNECFTLISVSGNHEC